VACTQLDGVPVAVTGSNDATARVWELRERRAVPIQATPGVVNGLAPGDANDVNFSCGETSSALSLCRKACPRDAGTPSGDDVTVVGPREGPKPAGSASSRRARSHLRGLALVLCSSG